MDMTDSTQLPAQKQQHGHQYSTYGEHSGISNTNIQPNSNQPSHQYTSNSALNAPQPQMQHQMHQQPGAPLPSYSSGSALNNGDQAAESAASGDQVNMQTCSMGNMNQGQQPGMVPLHAAFNPHSQSLQSLYTVPVFNPYEAVGNNLRWQRYCIVQTSGMPTL